MTSDMPERPNRFRVDFEPLLDEIEVMKRLGVSRPTLRRLVASGDLRCVKFMRHRRYRPRDVVDFIDSHAPRN